MVTLGFLLKLSLHKNENLAHLQGGITDLILWSITYLALENEWRGNVKRDNKFLSYCRYWTEIPKTVFVAVQEVELDVNLLTQLRILLTSFSQRILWNSYDQDQVLAVVNWETYVNETQKPEVDRGERNLSLWMALTTLPPPHFGGLANQAHQESSMEKHLSLTPAMLVNKVPPPSGAPFF